ncbi:unnamed protein product [Clonostachys rhizophaga]|uniref:Uncharacterized protein n=1 Tax=Clonostachys rhizophaga TaxID=160324 RepID=A0A9N9VYY3_9HYPO|nr:unnamed protein product [Clonostachys rhizophaga]
MLQAKFRAANMAGAGASTVPNHPAAAKSAPRTMPMFPHVNMPFNGGQYAGNHHMAAPSHLVQPPVLPAMVKWQQTHGVSGPMMPYMALPSNFKGLPVQKGKKPAKKIGGNGSQSSSSPMTPPTPTPIGKKARQAISVKPAGVTKADRYDKRKPAGAKNIPTAPKTTVAPAAAATPPQTPNGPTTWKRPAKGPKTPPAAMLLSVSGCEDWQLDMARDLGLQDIAGPFEIGDAIYVIRSKSCEAARIANRRFDRKGRLAWIRDSDNARLEERPQQQSGEPVGNADGSFRGFKASETTLVTPRA